jgi:two-component system CheB/CheR fusion protein
MRLKPSTLTGSGYLVAVLATAAVAAFRIALQPFLADSLPFLFFPVAVVVAAWYGGFGPGLAATFLSAAAADYFFMPPYYTFRSVGLAEWVGVAVFVLTGVIISWLCELLHTTRRRLELEQRRLHRSIAARRDVEEELARSEADERQRALELESIYQSMPIGLAQLDRELRFVRVNPLLAEINGIPAAEHLGRTLSEVVPDIAPKVNAAFRRVLETGEPILDVEVTGETPAAPGVERAWLESWFPLRDAEGRITGLNVIAQEITERRRARVELRRVSEELRIVTESMDALVSRCSRDLRYLWVNRHYAEWLERPARDIVGHPIEEVIGEAAMRRLRPHFERVLRGEAVRYEDQVDFRRIGRRWIQAVYTPTFEPGGGVDGWVAVVVDIQDRKEAEEELRRADARKERFLATLAHELRNPLAPLRNALEILKHPGVAPSTAEAARAAMERQLSHAVRLVDDLLDTSRINRDALELRLERCELAAVVSQALETVRPFVESGAHRLEVSLPEEPVTLRADPVRLAQVLSNLIHNACKFSDPGRPVAVSARKSAGWIEISVRDEGIGFAPEDRDRLFEMFTQLDPARSRSRGGLGVGLSIVRRLVEMHGGRVEASSGGPGRGSEFRVSLPELALSTSAAEPFLRVPPRAPAAPRRILVVDDNADSASSLAALLELSGNDVRTAGDGLEAVGLAEEFSPDVVLLDIGLPGIDGYEAARRIRALPRGRMMLLVAVTGWGQSEDRRRSREAGFDHHMVKPLRASALETLLANFSAAHAAETREPGADASPTT